MPHNRYYLKGELLPEKKVILADDEWHHLSHVSRGKVGEQIELINGKGTLVTARIEEIRKKEGSVLIEQLIEQQSPPPAVILCLAISRMNHLEWAVEKATELGASSLWLFSGMLSEKDSLSENQLTRLHALVLAATKQCGRLYLPDIQWMAPLKEWKPIEGSLFLCDTAKDAPYFWDIPLREPLTLPVFFFIGPEKGFNTQEEQFLKTQLKAQGIKLHPHILRTETAPLVALSVIQRFLH